MAYQFLRYIKAFSTFIHLHSIPPPTITSPIFTEEPHTQPCHPSRILLRPTKTPQHTHNVKEEVNVRSLVYEEPDGVPVDGDLEHKVWRRPRLHHLPDHPIMVRVYQRLVKVKYEDLALH